MSNHGQRMDSQKPLHNIRGIQPSESQAESSSSNPESTSVEPYVLCVSTQPQNDQEGKLRLSERIIIHIGTLEFMSAANLALITKAHSALIKGFLDEMRREQVIDRTWLPHENTHKGQWIYFFTTRGARIASNLMKERITRPRIDERVSILLHHRTEISQAMAGLMSGLGEGGWDQCQVGTRLRSMLKISTLKGLYIPDAYLSYRVHSTNHTFTRHLFLEVDRGNETKTQLKSKFNALNQYYIQDHQRLLGTDRLAVAVTVPTSNRCKIISEVVREVKPQLRVLVSLLSSVGKGEFALDSWIDCFTGAKRHLLETLDGQRKGRI